MHVKSSDECTYDHVHQPFRAQIFVNNRWLGGALHRFVRKSERDRILAKILVGFTYIASVREPSRVQWELLKFVEKKRVGHSLCSSWSLDLDRIITDNRRKSRNSSPVPIGDTEVVCCLCINVGVVCSCNSLHVFS
jgi:hypothetical protein